MTIPALQTVQAEMHPEVSFEGEIPLSFGNDAAALAASERGVAIVDRSHWGRIQVGDADRLTFLHNQSTNDFKKLKPGQGCDTVFVTATARTLDLATAYVLDDAVLLTVSPGMAPSLVQGLDRYIFFADKVKLTDVSAQTALFSLIGPESLALLTRLGVELSPDAPLGSHQEFSINGQPVRIAVGSGLATPGYSLITAADHAASLWSAIGSAGALPLGDRAWNQLRIVQGRPVPGAELTADYNPLEAGLWQTISFDKGCYIGQETIARLDTYNGVKQQLWGFELPSGTVETGSVVTCNGDKVGVVTSGVMADGLGPVEDHRVFLGLAYVRTKAGGAGLVVEIAGQTTTLKDLPFLTRAKQI
jgi:tRNA-modifying protein YgfZ